MCENARVEIGHARVEIGHARVETRGSKHYRVGIVLDLSRAKVDSMSARFEHVHVNKMPSIVLVDSEMQEPLTCRSACSKC